MTRQQPCDRSLRDLPAAIRQSASVGTGGAATPETINPLDLGETEKRLITQALAATNGNITAAAKRLGISRRTLHRKLNEMDTQGRNVRQRARTAKRSAR